MEINIIIYTIIAAILVAAELIYLKIVDRDSTFVGPNERSSHSTVVLHGGGIIFVIGVVIWAVAMLCGAFGAEQTIYPLFLMAVLLPLILMNVREGFIADSFLIVVLLSLLVFSFFNFRPRGKAKCKR